MNNSDTSRTLGATGSSFKNAESGRQGKFDYTSEIERFNPKTARQMCSSKDNNMGFSTKDLKSANLKNYYIGDIAVCYEIINKRAKKNDFLLEFDKAWIHGLLHLVGYDHIKNKDYYKMLKLEKKILNSIY